MIFMDVDLVLFPQHQIHIDARGSALAPVT
jgi:hypothetical protein